MQIDFGDYSCDFLYYVRDARFPQPNLAVRPLSRQYKRSWLSRHRDPVGPAPGGLCGRSGPSSKVNAISPRPMAAFGKRTKLALIILQRGHMTRDPNTAFPKTPAPARAHNADVSSIFPEPSGSKPSGADRTPWKQPPKYIVSLLLACSLRYPIGPLPLRWKVWHGRCFPASRRNEYSPTGPLVAQGGAQDPGTHRLLYIC